MLRQLCLEKKLSANDILDAWPAAAVLQLGKHLVTFDAGFKKLLRRTQLTVLASNQQTGSLGNRPRKPLSHQVTATPIGQEQALRPAATKVSSSAIAAAGAAQLIWPVLPWLPSLP